MDLKVESTIWYFSLYPQVKINPSAESMQLVNKPYQILLDLSFLSSYFK
jgi:hypothetical protein